MYRFPCLRGAHDAQFCLTDRWPATFWAVNGEREYDGGDTAKWPRKGRFMRRTARASISGRTNSRLCARGAQSLRARAGSYVKRNHVYIAESVYFVCMPTLCPRPVLNPPPTLHSWRLLRVG